MLLAYLQDDHGHVHPATKKLAEHWRSIGENTLQSQISIGQTHIDNLDLATPTLTYHLGRNILAEIMINVTIQEIAERN